MASHCRITCIKKEADDLIARREHETPLTNIPGLDCLPRLSHAPPPPPATCGGGTFFANDIALDPGHKNDDGHISEDVYNDENNDAGLTSVPFIIMLILLLTSDLTEGPDSQGKHKVSDELRSPSNVPGDFFLRLTFTRNQRKKWNEKKKNSWCLEV